MTIRPGLVASVFLLATSLLAHNAVGGTVTYIAPSGSMNSNASWPGGTAYSNNFGIAFITGSSGPFDIDWIDLQLNTSGITSGAASLTVALRNTTNSTAYSAVAGTTVYAQDVVSFSMPNTAGTNFTANLTSADLPNISAYSLQSNTSYALILYAPSVAITMARQSGLANGTTNNYYTVSNGFTMLDTFRNNGANYSNNVSSYPALGISFGATTSNPSSVPEPSVLVIGVLLAGGGILRRFRSGRRRD